MAIRSRRNVRGGRRMSRRMRGGADVWCKRPDGDGGKTVPANDCPCELRGPLHQCVNSPSKNNSSNNSKKNNGNRKTNNGNNKIANTAPNGASANNNNNIEQNGWKT